MSFDNWLHLLEFLLVVGILAVVRFVVGATRDD
jgi:hypothetical protein